jgi:hypothetical protein
VFCGHLLIWWNYRAGSHHLSSTLRGMERVESTAGRCDHLESCLSSVMKIDYTSKLKIMKSSFLKPVRLPKLSWDRLA